ncbi:30S ribosomal protein S12 methylthiotransferase RimO [Eubacteriaceae bacterium ES2]|nr:30S ribosomal protein S12 methylthiotransferase RimO [Eubacteriaceae bacterium ES2]
MKKNLATKIHITTLGCDKNTIDSQLMAGLLKQGQRELVDDPEAAQVIIVNTCCFIQEAKEESIDYILEYVKLKEVGLCHTLIVAGCMAQRYHQELAAEIPEIDGFLGVGHFDKIIKIIDEKTTKEAYFENIEHDYAADIIRELPQNSHTAYLRISEGCDHGCTYCAIPAIRGKYRSRSLEAIRAELRHLEKSGIKEVILIGQDIAPYGQDLDEQMSLPKLLATIAEGFNFKWIRMLYLYPEGVSKEILAVMKEHPAICHYFDIPLQHTRTEVLKRMGRKMTTEKIETVVKLIKNTLPDALLRTTLITGFPGETDEEHQALLEDVERFEFDHLGVFKYSCEEGTPAADFLNQIDDNVKEERYHQIMSAQQAVSRKTKKRFVGQKLDVLIEEVENETCYGRFYGFAPEIDGQVIIESPTISLTAGKMIPVYIVDSLEYDLIGEV